MKEVGSMDAAAMMRYAEKVIIVPGYGMAVAGAQHKVWELTKILEEAGVEVLTPETEVDVLLDSRFVRRRLAVGDFATFERITRSVRAAARERPLLVVLDDLHWADTATLRTL